MSVMIKMLSNPVVIMMVIESFYPDHTVQWPVARKAGKARKARKDENKTIFIYSFHFSLWPFLACLAQAVAIRFEQKYLLTPTLT